MLYKKNKIANLVFICDFWEVVIIDNGIGIPKHELQNIFNPMYRGSNAEQYFGHGIGLSIVKRISDIHEAKINIESEINIGTTITVSFHKPNNSLNDD